MSPAVSDAGPLIHLSQVGRLHLLRDLFDEIHITRRVKEEAADTGVELGYEDALTIKAAIGEGWIIVRDVPDEIAATVERLAEDENISTTDAETLLLASTNGTENVLIDEKILSNLARMHDLKIWSTWTILLEGLGRGLVEISDIESAIAELAERRHKLTSEQAKEILEAAKLVFSREKRAS
jgi:predicted nucleic acid-binding protein